MRKLPPFLMIPLIIFSGLVIAGILSLFGRHGDVRVGEADSQYVAGETAATIAERKEAFNRALELYSNLETDYDPKLGTGRLYYNIANTYFQLEEYPLAILYYQRAKLLLPRDHVVDANLAAAQTKLNIAAKADKNAFSRLLFFHFYLSKPERLQLFFIFSAAVLICFVAYLWVPKRVLRILTILFLSVAILFSLSLAYSYYFSDVEAVMIHSSILRRDAGVQYAKVTTQPIPAGTKVDVLELYPDRNWFKIATPSREVGYVPQDSLRIID